MMGPAPKHAEAVRRTLALPSAPPLSAGYLMTAETNRTALKEIHAILNNYHHTNALALVVLSALLEHYDLSAVEVAQPRIASHAVIDMARMVPALPRLSAR